MDKYQKQVQSELLEREEENKKRLAANYREALKEIKKRLAAIMEDPGFQGDKTARAKWDRMLEAQLGAILERLEDDTVSCVSDYLDTAYREAYLGCIYGLHQEGVGLVLEIDEDKVERSLERKTEELRFSERLYKNTEKLKDNVKEEMARGFSTGSDYATIARQVSLRAGISLGRACTIARTEGHRVTEESRLDCMRESVKKGARTVKQWDSTLDDVTRGTHRELDGQIREVEEPFEIPSTGARAMHPGGFGIAKEDINCRCAMTTRAKWALSEEEYKYSRFSGAIVSVKSGEYRKWKEKYRRAAARKDTGLNDTDKRALYDYISFKSYVLNEALRNGRKLTPEQEALTERLDAALDKLPSYKGNLSRSLYFKTEAELMDFINSIKVGDVHNFGQYVSCTCGDTYNPDGNVQLFIRGSSRGKDMTAYNETEMEVLYKRDVQFEVLDVILKDGVYYLYLKEAD